VAAAPPPLLLVGGLPHVRRALEVVLRGDGYPTVVAETGDQALAMLGAGLRPCLVLVDLVAHEAQRFREQLLADRGIAEIPILYLSEDGLAAAETERVGQVLPRPLSFDRLGAIVREHCRNSG
jgi:two-component system KDP operon response regulator KdpE